MLVFLDSTRYQVPSAILSHKQAKQVRGESIRALKALVEEQDPRLLRTGLAKVQSKADGSVAWVSEEGKGRFDREGQRAVLAFAGTVVDAPHTMSSPRPEDQRRLSGHV